MSTEQFEIPKDTDLPALNSVKDKDKLIKLCATLSMAIYDKKIISTYKTFEKELKKVKEVKDNFPDLQVHFIFTELGGKFPFSDPPLAAITTGENSIDGNTLIFCWRGSTTLKDWILNFDEKPASHDSLNSEFDVQTAYYGMIKKYFNFSSFCNSQGKGNDVVRLIQTGSKNINHTGGKPVQRIIMTGHSLGGGLAQVAHVYFTNEQSQKIYDAVRENNVDDICTIGFCAPMSISVKEGSKSSVDDKIKNMANFAYDMDVVPHLYSHLEYLKTFVEYILEAMNKANQFTDFAVSKLIESQKPKLELYVHFGKIFYYEKGKESEPIKMFNNGYKKYTKPPRKTNIKLFEEDHSRIPLALGWWHPANSKV